jgi:hypothetical protein
LLATCKAVGPITPKFYWTADNSDCAAGTAVIDWSSPVLLFLNEKLASCEKSESEFLVGLVVMLFYCSAIFSSF